uniref:M16C_associated domain-containing protein n=1 Tax=Macrostomum lignano TaxID=282301 RepID=A0A1I8JQL6_9PLAT
LNAFNSWRLYTQTRKHPETGRPACSAPPPKTTPPPASRPVRLVQSSGAPAATASGTCAPPRLPTFRLTLEEAGARSATAPAGGHLRSPADANNASRHPGCGSTPTDSTACAPTSIEPQRSCGSAQVPAVRIRSSRCSPAASPPHERHALRTDFTIYPTASTQNPTDFATTSSLFYLEGWRLESPSTCRSRQSPITINGVACVQRDEGVFSDPDQLTCCPPRALPAQLRRLPGAIPRQLSHEQLLQFTGVTTTRPTPPCFTYGRPAAGEHLRCLGQRVPWPGLRPHRLLATGRARWSRALVQAARAPARVDGPLNPFLAAGHRQVTLAESFPVWRRLPKSGNNFHLHFVSSCSAKSGRHRLRPVHGFSSDCRNTAFHIGLKGLADESGGRRPPARVDEHRWPRLSRSGFRQGQRDSLLHQVELGLRDEGANFGLEKILALAGPANHGADLAELLASRGSAAGKTCAGHWPNSRAICSGQPPTSPLSGAKPKSSSWLRRQRGPTRGRCHGWRLATCRDRRPAWSNRVGRARPPAAVPQPTNGLVYFRLTAHPQGKAPLLSTCPPNQTAALPLLSLFAAQAGHRPHPYGQLAEAIDLVSGGFACTPYATARPDEAASSCESGLVFSACCLAAQPARVLQLWQEICAQPDWAARDRLRQPAAHGGRRPRPRLRRPAGPPPASASPAGCRPADRLDSLRAIKLAAAAEPAGFDALAEDLADLCRTAFRRENFCISLTGEQPETGAKEVEALPGRLLMSPTPPQPTQPLPAAASSALRPRGGATGTASGAPLRSTSKSAPWG